MGWVVGGMIPRFLRLTVSLIMIASLFFFIPSSGIDLTAEDFSRDCT